MGALGLTLRPLGLTLSPLGLTLGPLGFTLEPLGLILGLLQLTFGLLGLTLEPLGLTLGVGASWSLPASFFGAWGTKIVVFCDLADMTQTLSNSSFLWFSRFTGSGIVGLGLHFSSHGAAGSSILVSCTRF